MPQIYTKYIKCFFCGREIFAELEGDEEKGTAALKTNIDEHWPCVALGVVLLSTALEETYASNGDLPSPSG